MDLIDQRQRETMDNPTTLPDDNDTDRTGIDWNSRGNATAIIEPSLGRTTSYGELKAQVDAVIDHLGPERQLLLVEATPTLSTIVLYLTAWFGRHVVILCPPDRPEDFARLADRFAPDAIAGAGGDAVSRLMKTTGRPSKPPHPALALVLPTSGSTGAAKAVRLSRDNLMANARSIVEYLGIAFDERALLNLPIHYSYGLSVLNSHLLAGASVILDQRSMIDAELWADAERLGATSFVGVPFSYELLDQVDLSVRAPTTLRYFTQAGGRLPADRVVRYAALARQRGWRFFVMYGQTEATARMAYLPPDRLKDEPDAIGHEIPGGSFSLRDEDGNIVDGPNAAGELIYSGPNVMMGYATERDDLALPPQPPVLATGDLAERTPSGLYRITGRKSRFVKIFGNRIDLDEVEKVLGRKDISAVVTGSDERLVVVTPDETSAIEVATILVPTLKLPAERIVVLALAELPRLPSGKIDYQSIRLLGDESMKAAPGLTATGAMAVRDAFVRAFGDDAYNDAASFLSLGGDSLTYVTMAITLEDQLGILPEHWESMTVGELVTRAEIGKAASNSSAPRTAVRDNLDTLRGLACLLVVAFHVVGNNATMGMKLPITSWWHVAVDSIDFVRMPLFTAMAGYFYALMPGFDEPRTVFIKRKARSLLVPAIFVGSVIWLARTYSGAEQNGLFKSLAFGYMHLWYLNALFAVFVIIALIEHRKPMPLIVGLALAIIAIPTSIVATSFQYYFVHNILYLLPYFLLGIGMRRLPHLLYTPSTIFGGAIAGMALLCCELIWRSSNAPIPSIEPIMVLLGGFLVVPPLFRFMPRIPALAWLGAYSITIYLWHPFANGAMRAIVSRTGSPDWVLFVTGIIAGVALPITLHRVVEHWPRFSLPLIGR